MSRENLTPVMGCDWSTYMIMKVLRNHPEMVVKFSENSANSGYDMSNYQPILWDAQQAQQVLFRTYFYLPSLLNFAGVVMGVEVPEVPVGMLDEAGHLIIQT